MFKLSRGVPVLSTLNYKDVIDNLLKFARGLNSINRDSLKESAVTRAMLDENTCYEMDGQRKDSFDFYVEEASPVGGGQAEGELHHYNIARKFVKLDSHEIGQYIIAYRVELDMPSSTGMLGPQCFFNTELFVDGIRVKGLVGGDCLHPNGFSATDPSIADLTLSGACIATLVPGNHQVDVYTTTQLDVQVDVTEFTISRFNW